MRYLLDGLNRLVDTYHPHVTFVFVYIMEAHATNEWPYPGINDKFPQHTTLLERAVAAKHMLSSFHFHPEIHFVMDDMSNSYNTVYASWPFRYYIHESGRVVLKEMPVGDTVSLHALEEWLSTHVQL